MSYLRVCYATRFRVSDCSSALRLRGCRMSSFASASAASPSNSATSLRRSKSDSRGINLTYTETSRNHAWIVISGGKSRKPTGNLNGNWVHSVELDVRTRFDIYSETSLIRINY
nr:PREDICTED: uncharacterized protein LOC108951483 [Musa acuminata subsp. malaccensis]